MQPSDIIRMAREATDHLSDADSIRLQGIVLLALDAGCARAQGVGMTTITIDRAVVEQALSLCESVHGLRTYDEDGSTVWCQELIESLRAALKEKA